MSKRLLLHIALDYDTSTKSTSESADRENTYELLRGNIIRVGGRTFPLHGNHDKSSQSITKCYDDIHNNLHDDVMSPNDADAVQGIGERMMKDQNAV